MNPIGKLVKLFLATAAAAVLILGAGYARAAEPAKADKANKAPPAKERVIELSVTDKGYEPTPIKLKKDEPVRLKVTRKTEKTCATELVLKEHGINAELPLGKTVEITFTPGKSGTLKYGCGMGMMLSGQFVVE